MSLLRRVFLDGGVVAGAKGRCRLSGGVDSGFLGGLEGGGCEEAFGVDGIGNEALSVGVDGGLEDAAVAACGVDGAAEEGDVFGEVREVDFGWLFLGLFGVHLKALAMMGICEAGWLLTRLLP